MSAGLGYLVVVDVRTTEMPDLYELTVSCRTEVDASPLEVRVDTKVWRP